MTRIVTPYCTVNVSLVVCVNEVAFEENVPLTWIVSVPAGVPVGVPPLPPPHADKLAPTDSRQRSTSPQGAPPCRFRESPQIPTNANPDTPQSDSHNANLLSDIGGTLSGFASPAALPAVVTVTLMLVELEPFNFTELVDREQDDCAGAPLQVRATV